MYLGISYYQRNVHKLMLVNKVKKGNYRKVKRLMHFETQKLIRSLPTRFLKESLKLNSSYEKS